MDSDIYKSLPKDIICPHCEPFISDKNEISELRLKKIWFKQDSFFKSLFNIKGEGRYYAKFVCDCATLWWCKMRSLYALDDFDKWKLVALDEVYETRYDCWIGQVAPALFR